MNDDDTFELEVTMTFAVPVPCTHDLDPHQMATHLREQLLAEEAQLKTLLIDAVDDDFDLRVRPAFVL